jgi:aldehyde dehydrogenase (NAD+)
MTDQAHPFLDDKPKRLLIGAEWVEAASGRTFESRNPATGALLAQVAEGGAEDIERAVKAARAAFNGPWRRMRPGERQAILLRLADLVDRHFDELSLLDTLDMGAPIRHTRGSRGLLVGMLRWYAGMATALYGQTVEPSSASGMFACTVREPVGIVGAIIPWNGPLWATIWKCGPVLATGCTMVLKPSEEAPLSPLRFGELALEAGVPPGVINIVTGMGAAGGALAAHPDVDKVSFTGSHLTGQKIVQASSGNLKRLSLELGGKSPNIVFADADLSVAAPAAAMAVFANAGQICSAGTRLYVERPIYEEFVQEVARFGRNLRVGDGTDVATDIGPLVSGRQLARVTDYMQLGAEEGVRVVSGGNRLTDDGHADGFFVPPTVFADVRDPMRIAREEIFGPVVSAMAFDAVEDVIQRANDTPFGLGAGVWTRDIGRAHYMASAIRAGSVWINCYNALDPAMPFGGYKMSGYGSESGTQQLNAYLNTKAIWVKTQEYQG